MQLTEDERKVLEKWRNNEMRVSEAAILCDAMLRLFPVRQYGDLVIRWDDEITLERLVACGWVHSGINPALVVYDDMVVFHRWDKTWRVMSEWLVETKPRNMGEVWQLMERCGIEGHK